MEEKSVMRFFVLDINNENRARYLARVIRTQEGVHSSVYNYGSHILTVAFDPKVISVDYMKELASFSDCRLITEENVVEEYYKNWMTWKRLGKILYWEGLALVLLLTYLFLGISLELRDNVGEYMLTFIVLAGFITSLVWRKKIKDKIENGEELVQ